MSLAAPLPVASARLRGKRARRKRNVLAAAYVVRVCSDETCLRTREVSPLRTLMRAKCADEKKRS